MKSVLILPALNEAAMVGDLIRRTPRNLIAEVIVVDNGSTDATAVVAREAGARVVSEETRGYGAACFAGVTALPPDTDVAVFLDADGSQRPEEIPLVLNPILAGRADLVLGARRLAGRHPRHAAAGTRLVARYVAWRWRVPITDFGPLRAIRADLLRRLDMRDRAFGWPVEMVVKTAANGARILEVPVSHAPRQAGRSKVSGTLRGTLRAGYAFLSIALRPRGRSR
ncbi:MAG TPA: glycosyltransferase family 2 protein [Methylomirabilota bacterium]|jgi:glycosyltransferase involved in cell wall biosynthesis|nr:glycosyltransferase family 2 protein [Methylomirabilota bacterium]